MASKIRDRIVEHAVACFAKNGFSGCPTKEIAVAANVTEGSLFRLFGSKEKLFEESLASIRHQMGTQEEFERLLETDPLERGVKKSFAALYKKIDSDGARLAMFAMLERRDFTLKFATPLYQARTRAIAKRLRRAMKEGEVRKNLDAKSAASMLYFVLRQLPLDAAIMAQSKKFQLATLDKFLTITLRGILR